MDMINEKLERWYSMNEVCQYLGVTRDTCLTWIEKRGMPAVKIGRTWKFKISEVDEWMHSKRPCSIMPAEKEKRHAENN